MATTENTEDQAQLLVGRWIEAFNNRNVEAIVSLYADDAELFDSGMKHVRSGKKEIERWFTDRFQGLPTLTYSPTAQLFGDNQVAVTWIARGNGPRLLKQTWLTRRTFEVSGVSIFAIANSQIKKQHGYYDHLSVAQQLVPILKILLPIRL